MKIRELLSAEFRLSTLQLEQLESHYALLQRWNAKLNLTRIDSLEEIVRFHYGESLFLAQKLPKGALSIADVGSGAGFPGVPIAVSLPGCSITLVESDQRKAVFLREATRHLENVHVLSERAEAIDRRFEWIVSRAVRPAEILNLKIGRNMALLLTEPDLVGLPTPDCIYKSPCGNKRLLAMFHVEHDRIDQARG